jgi:hypothetical protein
MNKPPFDKEAIQQILSWIEQQNKPTTGSGTAHHTIQVRLKADNEQEAQLVRELMLQILPGVSLNSPREGSNPRYKDNQKWFLYGDIKITDDGTQIKRRRRKDAGKKRGGAK